MCHILRPHQLCASVFPQLEKSLSKVHAPDVDGECGVETIFQFRLPPIIEPRSTIFPLFSCIVSRHKTGVCVCVGGGGAHIW